MRHRSLLFARLALRRRPILYWLTTALVATLTAVLVGGVTARAEQAADRYGGVQSIVVAVDELAVGDDLAPEDVRIERVPQSFLPEDALTAVPEGATVLAPIFPGEVVVAGRLAPEGLRGVAALLPPGTLAMAVPTGAGGLRVAVGDVVDLLATPAYATPGGGTGAGAEGGAAVPGGAAGAGATTIVASGARVVDVTDETVTVAVHEAEATRVATALTQASITLALSTG